MHSCFAATNMADDSLSTELERRGYRPHVDRRLHRLPAGGLRHSRRAQAGFVALGCGRERQAARGRTRNVPRPGHTIDLLLARPHCASSRLIAWHSAPAQGTWKGESRSDFGNGAPEFRLGMLPPSPKRPPYAPLSCRLHNQAGRRRPLSQPAQGRAGCDRCRRLSAVDGLGGEKCRIFPDRGGMVGRTTRVTREGIAAAINPFCGYIVVEADTIEAAAAFLRTTRISRFSGRRRGHHAVPHRPCVYWNIRRSLADAGGCPLQRPQKGRQRVLLEIIPPSSSAAISSGSKGKPLQTSCGQQTYTKAENTAPAAGRTPKAKSKSALDKERAKTEKLLKKVEYTALKETGV